MIFSNEFFQSRPQELWTTNDDYYTFDDLQTAINQRKDHLEEIRGKKIALKFKNQETLYEAICILCGEVRELILLPADLDQAESEDLIRKCKPDALISDQEDGKTPIWNDFANTNTNQDKKTINSDIETTITIPTSGTTGKPKLISHSIKKLISTTKSNAEFGRNLRWGMMYEVNKFAGLQVFLQSIIGHSLLISKEDDFNLTISKLKKHRCNAISATPTMWRKIIMSTSEKDIKLILGTMGGEIADQKILDIINERFPTAKIKHIYASTEAGVGFSVGDGKAGFPVNWLSETPEITSLKILDNTLWIKSDRIGNSHGQVESDQDGYINSGDLVEVKNDRVFFVGRSNGTINVGGNKVQPEEVERALLEISQVAFCVVYAKKNSMTGSLVSADIVLEKNVEPTLETKKAIIDHCKKNLPAYKVPVLIRFTDKIQTNSNGKIKRN